MFVIDDTALVRHAAGLYLAGKPTNSLCDWAAASKVVDLAAARARLRPPAPPEPLTRSLMRTLANIDAALAPRKAPTDG
jgi:hypothetical protein